MFDDKGSTPSAQSAKAVTKNSSRVFRTGIPTVHLLLCSPTSPSPPFTTAQLKNACNTIQCGRMRATCRCKMRCISNKNKRQRMIETTHAELFQRPAEQAGDVAFQVVQITRFDVTFFLFQRRYLKSGQAVQQVVVVFEHDHFGRCLHAFSRHALN